MSLRVFSIDIEVLKSVLLGMSTLIMGVVLSLSVVVGNFGRKVSISTGRSSWSPIGLKIVVVRICVYYVKNIIQSPQFLTGYFI